MADVFSPLYCRDCTPEIPRQCVMFERYLSGMKISDKIAETKTKHHEKTETSGTDDH